MTLRATGPLVIVGDALLDRDLDGEVHRLCPDTPAPVLDDPSERVRPGGAALAALQAIAGAGAVLVSDYGNGVTACPSLRRDLTERARLAPLVWDPHPRGAVPVHGTRLATPNQAEAAEIGETPELLHTRGPMEPVAADPAEAGRPGRDPTLFGAAVEAAYRVRTKWPAAQLCITLGARGALLLGASGPFYASAPQVAVRDTCGAGDFFAGAVATALRDGAVPSEAVALAVAESADFLAAGGVAGLVDGTGTDRAGAAVNPAAGTAADAFALADMVREGGGIVAATGGCFDLLHAGHVQRLQAARRAGDCLIVCLNSDESVRALKGDGRPLNSEADRAAVLTSLDCVDAVIVFDETEPTAVLRKLRPDLWIKGGDYDPSSLPEAALIRSWDGQVLAVPYLSGRSTTRLVDAVRGALRV